MEIHVCTSIQQYLNNIGTLMLESVGQCSHTLRNDVHVSTHIYQSLNILCTLIVKFKQDGLLIIVLAVDVYTFLQQSKDDIQILNTRSFEDSGTS